MYIIIADASSSIEVLCLGIFHAAFTQWLFPPIFFLGKLLFSYFVLV